MNPIDEKKQNSRRTIAEMLALIQDTQRRDAVIELYQKVEKWMDEYPAAVRHHHWWAGGYRDHVGQVMNNALALYDHLKQQEADYGLTGKIDFGLDSLIICAFLHDFDKIGRYRKTDFSKDKWKKNRMPFEYNKETYSTEEAATVVARAAQHGLHLTDYEIHALSLAHGGWSDIMQRNFQPKMHPLAVVLHCADLLSGHIMGQRQPDTNHP